MPITMSNPVIFVLVITGTLSCAGLSSCIKNNMKSFEKVTSSPTENSASQSSADSQNAAVINPLHDTLHETFDACKKQDLSSPEKSLNSVDKKTNIEMRFALEDLTGFDMSAVMSMLLGNPGTKTFASSAGDLAWDKIAIEKQVEFAEEIALRLQRDSDFRARFLGSPESSEHEVRLFVSRVSQMFLSGLASEQLINSLIADFSTDEPTQEEKFNAGVRNLVFKLILDPLFLYDLNPIAAPTAIETAKRLAAVIWRSIPDTPLLLAAADGKLSSRVEVEQQIDRMLLSPKALRAFQSFAKEWLAIESLQNSQRSKESFPNFNKDLIDAMEEDLLFQVQEVLFENDLGPAKLFSHTPAVINPKLLGVYGLENSESGDKKTAVKLGKERQGILTHPAIATLLSAGDTPNAVKRATYTLNRFLCIQLPPPPPDGGVFQSMSLPTDATTRELFAAHSSSPTCASCHSVLDGVALALEQYDALGQYRTKYHSGRLIDASGRLVLKDKTLEFQNAFEMQNKLESDAQEQIEQCFTEHILENALRKSLEGALQCEVSQLAKASSSKGYKTALKNILLSELFWGSHSQ